MELTRCKRVDPLARVCGPADVLNRSYPLLARWPTGPINLVMETEPATCNLYSDDRKCCLATRPQADLVIERHVHEVITSFLFGCASRPVNRPCLAADLGANNGWMTAFMLSLGAHVVSVEPQSDLAKAASETAILNCERASLDLLSLHSKLATSSLPCRGLTFDFLRSRSGLRAAR